MARTRAELSFVNFDVLEKRLKPSNFEPRFKRNVRMSMEACGLIGEGEIIRDIDAGKKFAANAALTVAMKGSSRPLEDTGQLKSSINSKVTDWDESIVGVLANKRVKGRRGKPDYILSIAYTLHEGKKIRVTKKMRRYMASIGVPLKASTKYIIIPPRKFLLSALSREAKRQYKKEWNDAVQRSLKGVG